MDHRTPRLRYYHCYRYIVRFCNAVVVDAARRRRRIGPPIAVEIPFGIFHGSTEDRLDLRASLGVPRRRTPQLLQPL